MTSWRGQFQAMKQPGTSILTSRLRLCALQEEDCSDRYVAWLQDDNVTRFLEARWSRHDKYSLGAYVAECLAAEDVLLLKIERRDSRQHIGNIKLGPIDNNHLCGEVGYFIGDLESWGCGYASEAVSAVVDWAFEACEIWRLSAGCYYSNMGSVRVLEKAGFVLEGRERQSRIAQFGDREDVLRFGVLRSDRGHVRFAGPE